MARHLPPSGPQTARVEDPLVDAPIPIEDFIEVSGSRLHYRLIESGDEKTPLVFLHEGLGSVELWRDFPAQVVARSGHPGLVYSRRGHGWSEPLTKPRQPDFMHREALEVLPILTDTLLGRPPILIGHSDGASIAIIFAGHGHPVEGLILIAPHVFPEPAGLESISAIRASFPESEMAEKMSRYHHDPEGTFRGWADVWLSPEFLTWNIEEYLEGIRSPVLLIQSEGDNYGGIDQLVAIEEQVSGAVERLLLPGDSHSPHLSHAEEVKAASAGFIRSLSGGAS